MNHPLLALPIFIAILLIAIAFGCRVLSILRVNAESSVERFVFGSGLGLGVLAYVILGVGLVGGLYPGVLGAVVLLMGLFSAKEIARLVGDFGRGVVSGGKSRLGTAGVAILFSIAACSIIVLVSALAPPSGLDWDSLSYHLAVPKIYLQHHRIIYIPFMSHSNFPFLIEMLYTLGLSFGSIGAAKLFHFGMYALSAASIYALGRRHLNARTGAVGALIFMAAPVVVWEAGTAYADIATALYVTLAAYAVANWEERPATNWLVLAGIMCGFALGTKVFAAVPTIALCTWILLAARRTQGWGGGFRAALVVGGVALIVGSPWYVKSWVFTGNPVYPFLYSVFGGKYWSEAAAEAYRGAQSVFGMGKGFRELLLLPWNLTQNGAFFFDDPNARSPKVFSLLGPVFLALIPVGVLAGGRGKLPVRLGLVAGAYLVAWFFLMQQVRYFIGALPLIALIAAWGLDAANREWRFTRHVANGLVGLSVVLSLFVGAILATEPARAAIGLEPASSYLSRTLDCYDTESYANETLPDNARIVLFDEVRGFYLDRPYMWGNPGHHEMTPWARIRTGPDMVRYFSGRGYTHAIVNWNLAKYAGDDLLHGKLLTEAIGRGSMREVYASHGVSLYQLEAE